MESRGREGDGEGGREWREGEVSGAEEGIGRGLRGRGWVEKIYEVGVWTELEREMARGGEGGGEMEYRGGGLEQI